MELLILDINCSDPGLGAILTAVRNVMTLIHIIAPILLIIMASMHLFQLMRDPDNKKLIPKIKNSFIAAAVIFFIPTLVNVVMAIIGNNTTVSECWNSAKSNTGGNNYIEIDKKKKTDINGKPSDYEKGKKKDSIESDVKKGTNTNRMEKN